MSMTTRKSNLAVSSHVKEALTLWPTVSQLAKSRAALTQTHMKIHTKMFTGAVFEMRHIRNDFMFSKRKKDKLHIHTIKNYAAVNVNSPSLYMYAYIPYIYFIYDRFYIYYILYTWYMYTILYVYLIYIYTYIYLIYIKYLIYVYYKIYKYTISIICNINKYYN